MKSDDARTDQQSLRDEFDTPQAVHAMVYARLQEKFGSAIYRGRSVSRREYATELAGLIRDDPRVEHVLKRRREIHNAMSVAAAIERARG